jgi:D-aspartate ligase
MRNNHLQGAFTEIDTTTPCVVICPGFHGHGAARSLGRLGIDVYGVHSQIDSPTARSKYWVENFTRDLSGKDQAESVDWFLKLGQRFKTRPILIASDDHSCMFVDNNAEELSKAFLFHKQPAGLTGSLSNKKQLYELCKKNNILTAETSFPQIRADVEEFSKTCSFPVMVKGIDTVALQKRTGVRMVIAENAASLLKSYDELEEPGQASLMLQEFIPGDLGNIWMFDGYFNASSDCLFGITGRKIRQYPAYTGMTSLGICEKNPELEESIRSFMKAVGYKGILDIGYKYNPLNGKYYLLDPNPRLGATFRLFVDSAGMDVVRAMYLDLTGQEVVQSPVKEGRKWLAEPFDVVSSLRYFRDGKLKLTDWAGSFSGVEEAQWFAPDDMGPFWKMCEKSVQTILTSKGDHFYSSRPTGVKTYG